MLLVLWGVFLEFVVFLFWLLLPLLFLLWLLVVVLLVLSLFLLPLLSLALISQNEESSGAYARVRINGGSFDNNVCVFAKSVNSYNFKI